MRRSRVQRLPLFLATLVVVGAAQAAAQPQLRVSDVTVGFEGSGGANIATFTVTLTRTDTAQAPQAVSVLFSTSNGTATGAGQCSGANADFVNLINGGLNFAAIRSDSVKTITITTCGDGLDEENETFNLDLFSASGASIADGHGVATIVDDDNPPTLRITDVTVTEGNTGTVTAVFSVILSTASGRTVTVVHATANGTGGSSATGGGGCGGAVDFVSSNNTLTFNAGVTSQPVNVTVCGDGVLESSETFNVNLSGATNASITDSQGRGTITNDEPLPVVTIANVSVIEGNSGTTSATFAVTLSFAVALPVTVGFSAADGSANGGGACAGSVDFVTPAANSTVSWAANDGTPKTITIPVCADVRDDDNTETFTVSLAGPSNATIGAAATGTGTITDDDATPTISVGDATVTEGDFGTVKAAVLVTLSAASNRSVTVDFAAAMMKKAANIPAGLVAVGGSSCGAAGVDFVTVSSTVNLRPGSTTLTLSVMICADQSHEGIVGSGSSLPAGSRVEGFTVSLSNAGNATIAHGQGGVVIIDDN